MASNLNPEVDEYINQKDEPMRNWLQELRAMIHEAISGVQEDIKWGQPVFFNPRNICYLYAKRDYVGLGFYDGSKLEDRDGLLEGQGKKLRHIKIRSRTDIRKELFVEWLKGASQNS
ncbi:DUF1801 domain-containing protein [candidate division KSB1 bacterium]|nr:DUF1801 domain-containing protein [candidate division KSB1 bacterium]NIR70470.1 DUF1801 domain-containing protein [candidate division KSB1 bacterium]NIS23200.1 DUF1801 domain-containing protein [candidate division KSB1 bacterium]NIT70060.1 DUF1801 domain-containing protein [candidate division KSB1 bacterium]NIU23697.1 DUF1801 domain-containing protein [candidate division KSB1 bacterium]